MLLDLAWLIGVLTLGLLSPGPDFLLLVKNSVGGNRARALGTALGISSGLAVHMTIISLGFAALDAQKLRVVQFIGVALLAWIGLRALLAPRRDAESPPTARAARGAFLQGLVCNATNPKALAFFVGVFAQVIPPGASLGWRIALPVIIVVHGVLCWTLIVAALQSPLVSRRLERVQHGLPRVFGAVLVVLAVVLLVENV